jgi:hypothetical protein
LFLSICRLLKDDVCNSAFITSSDWMIVNHELKKLWNES